MQAKQTVLDIRGLEKHFGPVKAVQGINLRVQRGEIFGFLGPNGAGKTTTIGMVLGLIYPTAGEIRLFGERVTPGHNQNSAPRGCAGWRAGPGALPFGARKPAPDGAHAP